MILLSLFINIITLCLASDSRADDILNNIKSVLKEFNEYVLIVNMCDGALQYENGIEYNYYAYEDYASDYTYDTVPNPPVRNFTGRKLTDARFTEADSFFNFLKDIFVSDIAELFYEMQFVYGDGVDELSFSNYPLIAFVDGCYYTTMDFTENTLLMQRYIDIDTISVSPTQKGYLVEARGSSLFSDGKVCDTDSAVKILFSEEDGELKIAHTEAWRDHIEKQTIFDNDEEEIQWLIEEYASLYELDDNVNISQKIISNQCSHPQYRYGPFGRYDNHFVSERCVGYYSKSDRYQNIVDIYDWAHRVFTFKVAEVFSQNVFFGQSDEFGVMMPLFWYLNDINDKIVLSDIEISSKIIKKGIISDHKIAEYDIEKEDDIYIISFGKTKLELIKIDNYGNGEYVFKINDF